MKILITGCFGFIGSNLTSNLLNAGHEVIGFDNLANPSINPTDRIKSQTGQNWTNFKFYKCDIRNYEQMLSFAINDKPDYIIHLAALGSVPRSFADPAYVMDVNVKGFVNVMTLATTLNVKRVIFASSSSVYGNLPVKERREDFPITPVSPYALSKRINEDFAQVWCKEISLKYVGLRFFNVYGPGQLTNSAYSAVIPKFINDKEIVINGDGKAVRDFTYVDDVCEAIELSLTTNSYNQIYNVGTGTGVYIDELAKAISRGKKEIKYSEDRPGDIKQAIASTIKAESNLKFKAAIGIEEGLDRTIAYYEGLRGVHSL